MGGLGGGVTVWRAVHLASLHLGVLHPGSHHGPHAGGAGSVLGHVGEGLLELDSLDVLGVLAFLLDVLVSLQQLVVLRLSQLESLVQVGLELLLQGVHLVLLLLDKLGLGSDDFLVSLLHVLLPLDDLELGCLGLDLMGLSISLWLGMISTESVLLTSSTWQESPGCSGS